MKTNKDTYIDAFKSIEASQEFKEKLMNITNNTPKKKSKKVLKITSVLVAAAVVAVSSISVYAGITLYNMHTEQNGKYAQTLVLEKSENNNLLSKNNKKPKYLKIDFDYMPKNYVKMSDTTKVCYSLNDCRNGGISSLLYDVSNQDKITDERTNIIDSQLVTVNGHQALYLQTTPKLPYDDEHPTFDKDLYIYLDEYDYLLYIYGGTDLSKEEILKIAESATVTECSKAESSVIIEWQDNAFAEPTTEEDANYSITSYVPKDKNTFFDIGKSITLNCVDFDGNDHKLDITVNSVEIANNVNMVPDESFKEKFTDGSGKIKPLEVKLYNAGDGVNTLTSFETPDEIKNYDLKFVYETVTYKNSTNKDINNICLDHSIVNSHGDKPNETLDNLTESYGVVAYDPNFEYKLTEYAYDDFSRENTNNPNYINVPANSEVTVHIGYFVIADDITEDLYLCVENGVISAQYNSDTKSYTNILSDYYFTKIN